MFLSVWKAALDALRSAEEWVIIGYSFPDEDLGIRALLTRAYEKSAFVTPWEKPNAKKPKRLW